MSTRSKKSSGILRRKLLQQGLLEAAALASVPAWGEGLSADRSPVSLFLSEFGLQPQWQRVYKEARWGRCPGMRSQMAVDYPINAYFVGGGRTL